MSSKRKSYSRREFLKTAAVGRAALTPAGRVLGAGDEIRVAVVGLGGKRGQHARVFSQLPGARLVALCDVDPKRLAEHVQRYAGVFSATDPRKILERNDVDAFTKASQTVARLKQHLLANEVDLQKTPLSLGPWLTVDPRTERITEVKASGRTIDIKAAEGLARGSYRSPFVVPERVESPGSQISWR